MRFIQVYISLIAIAASVYHISGCNNDSKNENANEIAGITQVVPQNGAPNSQKKTNTNQQNELAEDKVGAPSQDKELSSGVSANGAGGSTDAQNSPSSKEGRLSKGRKYINSLASKAVAAVRGNGGKKPVN